MSHVDPDVTIADNLEEPKKAKVDGQEFEQHSIPDQIEGAKYLKDKDIGKTGKSKFLGMIVRQFNPPGTA